MPASTPSLPDNDPRIYPDPSAVPPALSRLHVLADASLSAPTGVESDASDRDLRRALSALLQAGDGAQLAQLLTHSPSGAIYRHLWRLLEEVARTRQADTLSATVFALPLVIVAGHETPGDATIVVPGIVPDIAELQNILRKHGALAGNETFALANALVGADALDISQLPALHAWQTFTDTIVPPRTLVPAPLAVTPGSESAHLRFLLGTAVAASGAELLRHDDVRTWGMPFAQALARQLAVPGVSLLALPRAMQPPLSALAQGRAAQRDVGALLFASNAIRKLRASVGEPTAVISLHRVGARDGEARLSLSSPFDPREAEGFRWPLLPLDRVDDAINALRDLMHDCRVTDIRIQPGIHGDRDPGTGLPLFFKEIAPASGHVH